MKGLLFVVLLSLIAVSLQKEYKCGDCHTVESKITSRPGYEACITYVISTPNSGSECKDVSNFAVAIHPCPPEERTNNKRDSPVIDVFGDCVAGEDDENPKCPLPGHFSKIDILYGCESKDKPFEITYCANGYDIVNNVEFSIKSGEYCDKCQVEFGFCSKETTTVVGDPHVIGFHNQDFDFDGLKGKIYNLLTSEDIQVNMYLDNMKFNKYDQTFIQKVGIKTSEHKFEVATKQFGHYIKLDGEEFTATGLVDLGNGVSVEKVVPENKTIVFFRFGVKSQMFKHNIDYEIKLYTPNLGFTFYVMKHLIDFQAGLYSATYPKMHGVIGQTAWNVPAEGEDFQFIGAIGDYEVSDIFADNFKFNLYTH